MDRSAFKPLQLNTAQRLLVALGVDDLRLVAHNAGRNESHTKTGPGRKHAQGKAEDKTARINASTGASSGFVQHANEKRSNRRKSVKAFGGIRQFKRATQAHRPDFDSHIPF